MWLIPASQVTFGQRGLQLGDLLRKVEGDSSITNDAVHVYYDIDGVYHTILVSINVVFPYAAG